MVVGDAHVFHGFLTPVLTQISFQSHRLLFSHASAEVRGENTLERNFSSIWSRTHNHRVMSPTRSPLNHQGGADCQRPPDYNISMFNVNIHRRRQIAIYNVWDLTQTSPGFYVSVVNVFWKYCGKRRNARDEQFLLFPQCFLPILENCLPFLSNLKLSSANPLSLEESKIGRLGKGQMYNSYKLASLPLSQTTDFRLFRIQTVCRRQF